MFICFFMFNLMEVNSVLERESLIRTLDVWEQEANFKFNTCPAQEEQIFEDHINVTKTFKQYVDCSSFRSDRKMFTRNDPSGSLQAVVCIEDDGDYLNLKFLIANPSTIRSGLGRSMIKTIFQECIDNNKKGIVTMSMTSSVPFYQKMGFKGLSGFSKEEGGYMRIKTEGIQIFNSET